MGLIACIGVPSSKKGGQVHKWTGKLFAFDLACCLLESKMGIREPAINATIYIWIH